MRIVVIGGAGMLGHKMFQILRERFPGTVCTTREDVRKPPFDQVELLQGNDVIRGVDVMDFDRLQGTLKELCPDFIVNCVGIVKQRQEAQMAIPSITINSLLPHKLAEFAAAWGGRVIHPSTDCVFDGKRGRYTEIDDSTAQDLYGKSKFLGELHCDNGLTLRTSIIGRELVEHRSLLDWFLAQQGKTVRGFKRVIYSGVTTNQLAEVVTLVIQKFPGLHGLFQVVTEPMSKHDLLCLIRDAYKLEVNITPEDGEISDRSMKGDKFREATGYVSPPWPELVRRQAEDPTPYTEWIQWP
ncbi:MAG: SDR family oxidoreductase [Verrucomicrobia bacterium]|nr:SDR family oxidoreductase [Verrucomicrobiota bacterium]